MLTTVVIYIPGLDPSNICQENTTASPELCTPDDSCEGHYICAADGSIECLDGWTGDNCTDRDFGGGLDPQCPDRGTLCKNGGTCFNETCCCAPGYTGLICSTDINDCLSDPCLNGGICQDEVNYYVCFCLTGSQLSHTINTSDTAVLFL